MVQHLPKKVSESGVLSADIASFEGRKETHQCSALLLNTNMMPGASAALLTSVVFKNEEQTLSDDRTERERIWDLTDVVKIWRTTMWLRRIVRGENRLLCDSATDCHW